MSCWGLINLKNEKITNKIFGNEKSNASVRNSPRGHQDVPAGQGVPEASGIVQDRGVRDGPASGDAGPGAADLRCEAGLRPEYHEAGPGPVRCHGSRSHWDERRPGYGQA